MELQEAVSQFLFHCQYEKNLSPKTLKAYSIDLRQFREYLAEHLQIATLPEVDKTALRAYIKSLFGPLKEKSIKQRITYPARVRLPSVRRVSRHLRRCPAWTAPS